MVASIGELWFNSAMLKQKAIEVLGGTVAAAAQAIGVSYQAVDKWPEVLPSRIADRVLAVLARRYLPVEIIGTEVAPPPTKPVATVDERRWPHFPPSWRVERWPAPNE